MDPTRHFLSQGYVKTEDVPSRVTFAVEPNTASDQVFAEFFTEPDAVFLQVLEPQDRATRALNWTFQRETLFIRAVFELADFIRETEYPAGFQMRTFIAGGGSSTITIAALHKELPNA